MLTRLHCVRLTLVKERGRRKEKRKIHIVPSVILQLCSRSSNLFAFAHAIKQQQHFTTKIFFSFYMMNITDEVSYKKRSIFASHNKRKRNFLRTTRIIVIDMLFSSPRILYIYIYIYSDCVR
jgi:hypothetical protein